MTTVKDVLEMLDKKAPVYSKLDFDNVGLLVGRSDREVSTVLVSLDITGEVIAEAAEKGADLIVSHHPLFFSLKSVSDNDIIGRKIISIIENGMSAICMHTNLDAAPGGVNDTLASALGLCNVELLGADGYYHDGTPHSTGRVGELERETDFSEYLAFVKKSLNLQGGRFHNAGRSVRRVGLVGGSGGSDLLSAYNMGCDTFVTADLKYDVFLDAKELGINLIDAGHFETENPVTGVLSGWIKEAFPAISVSISSKHRATARFM